MPMGRQDENVPAGHVWKTVVLNLYRGITIIARRAP